MTCENFREQLHILLDNKTITSLSKEMLNHKHACKECGRCATSILSVHEQLFQISRVKPSESFIKKLMTIENSAGKARALPSWKYDVRRALIFLSPLALTFFSAYLPTLASTLINFGILTTGLVFLLTTILKPMFFTRY
jgi:hypothetical protein